MMCLNVWEGERELEAEKKEENDESYLPSAGESLVKPRSFRPCVYALQTKKS